MRKLIFLMVFLLFSLLNFAQNTDYEWSHYHVGFSIAGDFDISTNNSKEFTAASSDGEIAVSIMPWKDADVTKADLEEAIEEVALEAFADAHDMEGDELKINGYLGYYLFIEKDADRYGHDRALFVLLLDPNSEVNLVFVVSFVDGHDNEIKEMIESIHPL